MGRPAPLDEVLVSCPACGGGGVARDMWVPAEPGGGSDDKVQLRVRLQRRGRHIDFLTGGERIERTEGQEDQTTVPQGSDTTSENARRAGHAWGAGRLWQGSCQVKAGT